jgi:hypothetical protein
MKFSFHDIVRGKPEKRDDLTGRPRLWQDGKIVNLGYGWEPADADWDTVFDMITVEGLATAPYLSSNNRKEENFVEHSFALVDIDKGMTIPQLFEHEFYNIFSAGFYTTPSHTDENPRFRIIHRLETPITSHEKMRKLYRGLMRIYGDADASCKDSARLFFGTVDCLLKEKRDNPLTDDAVECIIEDIDEYDRSQYKESDNKVYNPPSDARKKEIIDLLHKSYVGEYHQWRNIGWGMKTAGFSLSDYQYVTTGMMSQKSANDAKHIWNDSSRNEISLGSIIYFLKARYGDDCLKEEKLTFTDAYGQPRLKRNIIV